MNLQVVKHCIEILFIFVLRWLSRATPLCLACKTPGSWSRIWQLAMKLLAWNWCWLSLVSRGRDLWSLHDAIDRLHENAFSWRQKSTMGHIRISGMICDESVENVTTDFLRSDKEHTCFLRYTFRHHVGCRHNLGTNETDPSLTDTIV